MRRPESRNLYIVLNRLEVGDDRLLDFNKVLVFLVTGKSGEYIGRITFPIASASAKLAFLLIAIFFVRRVVVRCEFIGRRASCSHVWMLFPNWSLAPPSEGRMIRRAGS